MIRGARIYLRTPTRDDVPELVDLIRTSKSEHRPWVYLSADASDLRRWIDGTTGERSSSFLACLKDGDEIAGVFNLSEIVRGPFQNAYLAFYGHSAHQGRGFMSEGLSLVLKAAFTDVKLHRLEANIQPGNDRSRALVERNGFRLEGFSPRYLKVGGRWRDHERWAITREDR